MDMAQGSSFLAPAAMPSARLFLRDDLHHEVAAGPQLGGGADRAGVRVLVGASSR